MAFEFRFPDVGEGIHEGRIVEWLVAEGEEVRLDQPFVKVETDKAVVDLPAPKAGRVLELRFRKGDTIRVGEVLAVFAVAGEEAPPPAPA
ncbi:MAG: biotin/lipoyl-containing protein, partial [Acidobacteriota bacterium]